jgi:hypothetical protein
MLLAKTIGKQLTVPQGAGRINRYFVAEGRDESVRELPFSLGHGFSRAATDTDQQGFSR